MSYADAQPIPNALGALGENVGFQEGKSKEWLTEVQAQTAGTITDWLGKYGQSGAAANTLNAFIPSTWCIHLQAPDGSFPGTGQRSTSSPFSVVFGADFHTVAIWSENMGRAVYALKIALPGLVASPKPAVGPQWSGVNSALTAQISTVSASLYKTAQWQMTPAAIAGRDAYNFLNGHRRWYMAASMRFASILNGGVHDFDVAASAYEADGLSRVKGPGWQLAVFPVQSDGTTLKGTLVPPGTTPPIGYLRLIPAEGVDPESLGSDGNPGASVGYQINNVRYSCDDAGVMPAGAARDAVIACAFKKALWGASRLTAAAKQDGSGKWLAVFCDINGDSRDGIEDDIDGNLKVLNLSAFVAAYRALAKLLPSAAQQKYCSDISAWCSTVNTLNTSGTVATNGTNIPPVPQPSAYGIVYPTPVALPAPPAAPTGLAVVPGNNVNNVDWDDPAAGCTSKVYRNGVALAGATGLTVSQWSDTTAVNGTTYSYTVSYTDANGQEGAQCAARSGTPATPSGAVSLPAAPTNARIYASDMHLHPMANAVAGATSYRLYDADASAQPLHSNLVSASYVLPGLTDGIERSFFYTAVNTAGEGPPSATVRGTPNPPLPDAVGTLQTTPGANVIGVAWADVAGRVTFSIERDGVADYVTGLTDLTWLDEGALNNVQHSYRVWAVNVAGAGPYSPLATATAMATQPPVAATGAKLVMVRKVLA